MGSFEDFKKRNGISDRPKEQEDSSFASFLQRNGIQDRATYELNQHINNAAKVSNALEGTEALLPHLQDPEKKRFDAVTKDAYGQYMKNMSNPQYHLDKGVEAKKQADQIQSGLNAAGKLAGFDDNLALGDEKTAELKQKQKDLTFQYYSSLMHSPDFQKNSEFHTTANGKPIKILPKFDRFGNQVGADYVEVGYDDIVYDYINGESGATEMLKASEMADLSGLYGASKDYLEGMTPDEVSVFNYIYATQGKDAAHQFIDFMKSDLYYRQNLKLVDNSQKFAQEYPWLASAASVAMAPLKVFSLPGMAADAADGEIDPYAPYNKWSTMSSTIRDTVGTNIKENAGGGFWGGAGEFGYNTAMSMGDFLLTTAITGGSQGLSLAIMGSGAAVDTTRQCKLMGYDDNQALLLGAIAGGSEVFFEKIGMEKLFDLKALKNKGAARYVVQNILSEGGEEVGTELVNTIADCVIAADESQMRKAIEAYQAKGKTEGQAFALWLKDEAIELGLAGLGGMVSGGVMGGGSAAMNSASIHSTANQIASGKLKPDTNALVQGGLAMPEDTRGHVLAQQISQAVENGTEPDVKAVAELYRICQAEGLAVGETIDETVSGDANMDDGNQVAGKQVFGENVFDDIPEIMSPSKDTVLPEQVIEGTKEQVTGETDSTLDVPEPEWISLPELQEDGTTVQTVKDLIRKDGVSNGYESAITDPAGDRGSEGAGVSDGIVQRDTGTGTAEQTGGLGSRTEGRRAEIARSRKTAVDRQARFQRLRLEKVSSLDFGLENGTDAKVTKEIPLDYWDGDMQALAERIYNETGKEIRYVLGPIQIRGGDGRVRTVRGVYSGEQIIIQADNFRATMEQLADHEAYHAKSDFSEGRLHDEIRQSIVESFSEEEYRSVLDKYIDAMAGVYDVTSDVDGDAYEQLVKVIEEEVFADAYAGINAFGAGADRFSGAVNERMNQLYMGKLQEQSDGVAEPTGPPVERYSIGEIDGKNGGYGIGVILDTNIFDGVKTSEWGRILGRYVYNNLAGEEMTVYDENGSEEVIHLAKITDRVRKDGAKNSHRVIDKLARYRGDNITALATVHLHELLETSKYEKTTDEHNHQWMDEKGWDLRKTYIQDARGNIYEAILNIAKGRDRNILYAISNVRKIDEQRAAGGDVPSTSSGRGSLTNSNSSGGRISDKSKSVKGRFSFAGERARTADFEALERAKELQSAGVTDETIRQQTGWFVGMDGKWRWEIDDSGMHYDGSGDLRGAESAKVAREGFENTRDDLWNHADAATLENVRAYNRAVIFGDEAAEQQLYNELITGPYAYYFGRYVEAQDRARGTKGIPSGGTLQDYIDHPALFKAYPQLRDVTLRFERMNAEKGGHFNRMDNEIVLNESLKTEPENVLVHEIQHAIQKEEGFARGSSTEYWKQRQEGEDAVYTYDAKIRELEKQVSEILNQLPENVAEQFRQWRELDESSQEAMMLMQELGSGQYRELFSDYFMDTWSLDEMRKSDYKRAAGELYRNTAGEIEARDSASRRTLTAEERRDKVPVRGDSKTVFVEDGDVPGLQLGEIYSVDDTDSEGRKLSEQQLKYFKDSVVRDKQGRLMIVYHGSGAVFTEFDHHKINTHGSAEGRGFYFTNNKDMAEGYQKESGQLLSGYLDIKKPLSLENRTITKGQIRELLKKIDPSGDDILANCDPSGGMGYPSKTWYLRSLNAAVEIFDANENDAELIAEIANTGGDNETVMKVTRELLGYDGYIVEDKYDDATVYVSFDSNQFKNADNRNPTMNPDIRYSVDDNGQEVEQQPPSKRLLAKKKTLPVAESKPIVAKKDFRGTVLSLFSIPDGQKAQLGEVIDSYADRLIKNRGLTEADRKAFFDRMYESGVMSVPANEYYSEARNYLKGGKILVSDSVVEDFGDDWNDIRRRAFSAGIYLTRSGDNGAVGIDVWNGELSNDLPGLFDAEETDQRSILERIVQVAEEGKSENLSLAEYTARLAEEEYQSEDEFLDNMERQLDWALRTFAEKAQLEIKLRDRTGVKIAQEREAFASRSAKMRIQEAQRRAEERQARKDAAKRAKNRRELSELQKKTLKQLQWLAKNRNRAPEDLKGVWSEVLGDIDIFAVGAANEMKWSDKYNATWRDIAQMYKDAMSNDPNFMPSKELDRIVARLDGTKIGNMDIGALQDLYKAAIGLRTEFYNRNNVVNDEMHRLFAEVYEDSRKEIENAPGGYSGGKVDKLLNLQQLTPMNVFERMGGWNPDGTFYSMAKQLEQGEKNQRAYTVKSQKMLQQFLENHEDFVKKADGQGKDAIWYEIEVPELVELRMGDKPIFGDTVKVYMTPSQKVHMYLESKNLDNLHHMTGGRTFVDKDLYSKGKRQEAMAQGKTIRLAPETVRAIVSDLTVEEMELARLLDSYYNDFATKEINRVSNILYGYDKAMGHNYAPIYTNQNYTRSEFGVFDVSSEGVGNLKERKHAKNPSYNISCFDAFERHVERTARFCGMAIPTRNWQQLMNWRGENNSTGDVITHKWGDEGKRYINDLITSLQGGKIDDNDVISEKAGKIMSNYISSVFGANPSIVLKQLGSIPLAGAYLGATNIPKPAQLWNIDRNLIGKYTQELDWRTMGYTTPETKFLKENPNWTQSNKAFRFLFGGGAITAMDGWAASVLWPWAENKVRKEHPDLVVGTKGQIENGESPFYKKVAEEFDNAVSRSQSVSDEIHQGTLRKSKNPIARAFTLFRSDSAQTYNAIRQLVGEARYQMKNDRDNAKIKSAKRAVGAAFMALAANAVWSEAISFLMALWKNKAKKYRDDEEELTAGSVIEEMAGNMIGSIAGTVVGGEELFDIIGNLLTGEKWYGIDTPGLEQLNDMVTDIGTVTGDIRKFVSGAWDVVTNGGNLGNYISEHSDLMLGGIKKTVETMSQYVLGLPVKNVEAYLLGLVKWASPEFEAAYENAFDRIGKSDLSNKTGKELQSRVEMILDNRGISQSGDTANALSELYEEGLRGALPSDLPTSVTIDGADRPMGEYQQQTYGTVWNGIVKDGLDALVASEEFHNADAETKEKILKRLYEYASEQAKANVFDDYELDGGAFKNAAIVESGVSVSDVVLWNTLTDEMKSWEKAAELERWGLSDFQKRVVFFRKISDSKEETIKEFSDAGLNFDEFLCAYSEYGRINAESWSASKKATEFSRWVNKQGYSAKQEKVIKDELVFFGMIPADAGKYDDFVDKGMNSDDAYELNNTLGSLKPEAGANKVSNVQRWRVCVDFTDDKDDQLTALFAVMDEQQFQKVEIAYDMGVRPEEYVTAYEILQDYDADGNGSYKQSEITDALDHAKGLSNKQKAVMWQLMTGAKSAKNNPYNVSMGEMVLDAKGK